MTTSAEEALAALARDLVEEISAGRAVELAEDPDGLELAMWNIRPFTRTRRGVTEQVRGYQMNRGPGGGAAAPSGAGLPHPGGAGELPHPGDLSQLGHPMPPRISPGEDPHTLRSWISEEEWLKGQEAWRREGAENWAKGRAKRWEGHQKLHEDIGATRQQISGTPIRTGNGAEAWSNAAHAAGHDAGTHLHKARQHMRNAEAADVQFPGEHYAKAYQELHAAHQLGIEHALPRATSRKARKEVEHHLDLIQAHMEELDKAVGANPKRTREALRGERQAGMQAAERQRPLTALAESISNTAYQIGGHMQGGYRPSVWKYSPQEDAPRHLDEAQDLLHPPSGVPAHPGALAEAYGHLSEAHRIGVERVLAMVDTPQDKQAVREQLDIIQAHMEELDRLAGAKPGATRALLGGAAEQAERATVAGEAMLRAQAEEQRTAPGWLQPGRKVIPAGGGRFERGGGGGKGPGAMVTSLESTPEGMVYVNLRWDDGREGYYRLNEAKGGKLKPAPGQPEPGPPTVVPLPGAGTGMEAGLERAQMEALVGKRVRMKAGTDRNGPAWKGVVFGKGGEGTVTSIPETVFDMGMEEEVPNPGDAMEVVWDAQKDKFPVDVPFSALEEIKPEPPKGAAAVHPGMGGHLARRKGETVSGMGYAHVPQPMQTPAPAHPSAEARQLEQAGKRIAGYAEREQTRRAEGLAAHLEETRAREMEARGMAAPGTYKPLTDQEFAHHTRQLEETIAEAIEQGRATDQQYALDAAGTVWAPDRSMQHADIIKDFLDQQVDVPSGHVAIMLGGPPGAGKTTMLKKHADIDLTAFVTINTDHFKQELAQRGMVPEVPGLSPMEASALVHEESAYLADLATAELERRGKNIIFDGTMRNESQARKRVSELRRHGYSVRAMFVDTPVSRAIEQADKRYRKGLEAYRKGTNPFGGRHVPRSVLLSGEDRPGVTSSRATFDRLRDDFDQWELYDGNVPGGSPRLVQQGGKRPAAAGIPSVEELRRQLRQGTLGTEAPEPGSLDEYNRPLTTPLNTPYTWDYADAVDWYRRHGPQINKALLRGETPDSPHMAQLDELLSHVKPLTAERVVYRGTGTGRAAFAPGDVISDKTFTSMSESENVARGFKGQLMRVRLPVGTRAFALPQDPDSRYNEELEWLVPRGTQIEAESVDEDGIVNAVVTQQPPLAETGGIPSSEELRRTIEREYVGVTPEQAETRQRGTAPEPEVPTPVEPYTGATEEEALARQKGTAGP